VPATFLALNRKFLIEGVSSHFLGSRFFIDIGGNNQILVVVTQKVSKLKVD
jgi:hypothetical protein